MLVSKDPKEPTFDPELMMPGIHSVSRLTPLEIGYGPLKRKTAISSLFLKEIDGFHMSTAPRKREEP